MIDSKLQISSKQLFVFVLSAQLGIEVLRLPVTLTKYAGHDGWISVILTLVPSSLAIILTISLIKRYEGKSIYNINKLLFGKVIGKTLNLIFFFYCLITSSIVLRCFAEIVYITGFKKTPPLFIICMSLIPSIILLKTGLQAVCRFASIIIFVIIVMVLYCLVNVSKIDLLNLMPVGKTGFYGIINGMMISSYACLGLELVSVVFPHVTDKNKILSSVLLANFINVLFVLLIVFITTSIFGENMLKHLTIPMLSLFRIHYSELIERADIFFTVLWFPAVFCVFRAYFYAAYHGINEQYNVSRKGIFLIVLLILCIFFSRIPKSFNDVFKYLNIIDRVREGMVLFIIICYFFSFINKTGITKKGDLK